MSHFDDLYPAIRDGLAVFGFMTLCTIFCFLFFVAKDAWHDKREQDKANRTNKEEEQGAELMEYYDKPPFGSDNEFGNGGCAGYVIATIITILAIIALVIGWRLGL